MDCREAALQRILSVESRLDAEPGLGDNRLHFTVAWVLYQLGALRLAERATLRLFASSSGVRLVGLSSTQDLFLAIGVVYDRGALPEAAAMLEKLLGMRSPSHAPYVAIQRALIRAGLGQLDGLAEDLDALIAAMANPARGRRLHRARCAAAWRSRWASRPRPRRSSSCPAAASGKTTSCSGRSSTARAGERRPPIPPA